MNENIASSWEFPPGVTYLNHGSFGPSPRPVREAQQRWTSELERQPMEFLVRRLEGLLDESCSALAGLLKADPGDLVLVDNATAGMNIVAASLTLQEGDQVLLSDHEYGAVRRLWQRACQQAGAELVIRKLPWPLLEPGAAAQVTEHFVEAMTERTRLAVVSHVTSPTATILPVEAICREARQRGVAVCIDGPHAVGMLPLDLEQIGCDFYTASCHKWLSAPFGSGFLWVRRKHHSQMKPAIVSWGGSVSGRAGSWKDEFTWPGTRDPAPWLAVTEAIDFLEDYGWDRFREQTHRLAAFARERLVKTIGLKPPLPDSSDWYASMVAVPLPNDEPHVSRHGQSDPLQRTLQEKYGIEIPVVSFHEHRYLRVSCHLYNSTADIDRLIEAVAAELS